jgi:uncharacterized membrane protein YagU involved in acid resistance
MSAHIFSRNVALAVAAVSLLAIGVVPSVADYNFQWLSRFGTHVIWFGIISLARPTISGFGEKKLEAYIQLVLQVCNGAA